MAHEPKKDLILAGIKTTSQIVAAGTIVENPKNPRLHPPEQIERLSASIKRFGQPKPILIRHANSMVIAGHGVLAACREAGLKEISVLRWDVDQRTADQFMLADNRFSDMSAHDRDRVVTILGDVTADELASIGFDEDELEKLRDEGTDDIEVREVETDFVDDTFWISIRGPLRSQAKALQKLQAALEGIEDVTVELGNTPG